MAIKYRAWHKTLEFMLLHDEIVPYEKEQKPTKGDNYNVLDDDDFIIMKATGILDQDENEIYEGDINIEGGVISSDGSKFVIKFEDSDLLSQKLVGGELELIQGNIYETPYKIGIDNQDQDDDYDSDFDDDYDDSGFEDGFDDYDDEDEY